MKHIIYRKEFLEQDLFRQSWDAQSYHKKSICIPSIGITLIYEIYKDNVMSVITAPSLARFKINIHHTYIEDVMVTLDEEYTLFVPIKGTPILQYMKVREVMVNNYKMYSVNIGIPRKECRGQKYFVSGDWREELIVIGYLRRYCRKFRMRMMAMDLIKILVQMYDGEMMNVLNLISLQSR